MTSPGAPKVARAMEIKWLLGGNQRFTSKISKPPASMIPQQAIKKSDEFKKPAWAVARGTANIPPPIALPVINKIPPNCLIFIGYLVNEA